MGTVVSGLCQGADVSRVKQSKKYADMMSSSSISCLASSDQSSISSSSSLSSPLLGPSQPRSSQSTECQLRLGCLPSSSTSSIALSRGCIRSSTSNEKIHHNENSSTATGKSKKCKDKSSSGQCLEKMVIMKCQRLTPDKNYEEIEIEVPADIFNRIITTDKRNTENSTVHSFSRKLRNIFIR